MHQFYMTSQYARYFMVGRVDYWIRGVTNRSNPWFIMSVELKHIDVSPQQSHCLLYEIISICADESLTALTETAKSNSLWRAFSFMSYIIIGILNWYRRDFKPNYFSQRFSILIFLDCEWLANFELIYGSWSLLPLFFSRYGNESCSFFANTSARLSLNC